MKIKGIMPQGKPHISRLLAISIVLLVAACTGTKEETPVIPPPTYPLSQEHIGYGVINVQYTRINSEPAEDSVSLGYLRQGSVVRIAERRLIRSNAKDESWVYIEGDSNGWLRESLLDIYENEMQAQTASRSMGM